MVICLEALVKDKEILTNYYQNIDEADPMKSHFKKLSWETISALLKFGKRLKSAIITLQASAVPTLEKVLPILWYIQKFD